MGARKSCRCGAGCILLRNAAECGAHRPCPLAGVLREARDCRPCPQRAWPLAFQGAPNFPGEAAVCGADYLRGAGCLAGHAHAGLERPKAAQSEPRDSLPPKAGVPGAWERGHPEGRPRQTAPHGRAPPPPTRGCRPNSRGPGCRPNEAVPALNGTRVEAAGGRGFFDLNYMAES